MWHYFPWPLSDWFSRIIEHMLIYWLVRSVSQPASSNFCFNWTCQSFLNCSSKSDPASLSALCIFFLFNFYFWVPVFSPWLKLSFSILLSVLGSCMCFLSETWAIFFQRFSPEGVTVVLLVGLKTVLVWLPRASSAALRTTK